MIFLTWIEPVLRNLPSPTLPDISPPFKDIAHLPLLHRAYLCNAEGISYVAAL